MARSRRWLRSEWRAGRLTTRGLPPGVRIVAGLAVAVALAAAVLVVGHGLGVSMPGGVVEVPGRFVATVDVLAIPQLLIGTLLVGTAVAAAALAWSAGLPGARLSRLTLAAVALVDGALAAGTLGAAGSMRVLEGEFQAGLVSPTLLVTVVGVAGIVLALAVVLVPGRWLRRRPWIVAGVAATPPLLVGVAYVLLGGMRVTIGLDDLIASPDFPTTLTAQAVLAPSLRGVAQSASFLLVPFAMWQAVTWADATGGPIGQRAARRIALGPWLLWLLIVAKLAWLGAGYAGLLPAALGGPSPEWDDSLADGPIGWAMALAFAGGAGWWLASPHRRRVSRIGFGPVALILAIGFASWSLVMGALGLLARIAAILPTPPPPPPLDACATSWSTSAFTAVACLQDGLIGWLSITWMATVLLALVAGTWLLARRRVLPIAVFLVVTGVWALPRAANGLRETLFGDAPTGADAIGTVELATLDAAVTLVVTVLAVGWWLGRGPRADPWSLGLVLVVTTLLTRPATLVLPGWTLPVFTLALVFPLLYELGFDSEDLNEPSPHRSSRVLGSVGLRAGALTLLVVGLGAGLASPDDAAAVAYAIFAPPFAAWLVAGTISARHRRRRSEPIAVRTPARRHLAGGVAAGILAAAVLFTGSSLAEPLVTGAVTDPAPSDPPESARSERWRFLELLARIGAGDAELRGVYARAGDAPVEEIGAALEAIAAAELAWMADHPVGTCYADAWSTRRAELRRVEALATLLTSPGADEEAWTAEVNDALAATADAAGETAAAIEDAVTACDLVAR